MKTLKAVLKANSEYKELIEDVIANAGEESVSDINNHGIQGGFNGFIYYSDTHAFALNHQDAIVSILEDMADQLGQDAVELVNDFGSFRGSGMDKEDKKDLYKYLAGVKPEQGAITNVMAWFAAEEVCRMFED